MGPILGGALAYAGGWAWIFWFLAVASGFALLLIILFLPETGRKIVGNGSVPASKAMQLRTLRIMRHYPKNVEPVQEKLRLPNPVRSLEVLFRRDNAVIMTACGLLYVIYTVICASLSVLFTDIYKLTQWQAGLIYLPFGLGGTMSTFVCGPLLNRAYKRTKIKHGLITDNDVGDDLDTFPVEHARLQAIWIPLVVTVLSVIAFGWTLHHQLVSLIPFMILNIASGEL